MKPKSIAIVGARRDYPTRHHLRHVADPVARRCGAQCDGRCRAQTRRHRRHRHRRRDAGDGRTLSWPDPEMGRRHRGSAACSFMIHVRHAAAAIASGLCETGIDHPWRERPLRRRAYPQCRGTHQPRRPVRATLRAAGPPTLFTIPVLRYMKTCGLSHEQLAMVSVMQRECAGKNPRATVNSPALPAPRAGAWR